MRTLGFLVGVLGIGVASDAHAEARVAWATSTQSPRPLAEALDSVERAALDRCGAGDAGLSAAAWTLAARRAAGAGLADMDGIAFAQRAAGEPHPWARAWAATGATLEEDAVARGLAAWLEGDPRIRRCGVASVGRPGGPRSLVVLAVDALADLGPLPTRVRVGQWLTVEARLRVRASGGKVFVATPTGMPREVPSWFDGTTLRARFAPADVGAIAVQVLADLPSGPRPVLDATVFADADPPATEPAAKAPGEDATGCPAQRECHLAAMLAGARASVGESSLALDSALASVARTHAVRMAQLHQLAHDAGDGTVEDRLRDAGVESAEVAENVVRAPSLSLAHRALWASPSHRANMLLPGVRRVGVGVVEDAHGDVWAVEVEAR